MQFVNGVVPAVGNTPLIKLKRASEETGCTILGKAEFLNPGLSVKDRGLGLLPEEQGRLVHGVESGVPSGPSVGGGVGLWIVRQVILAHGGLIEVESQPGEGTTITVLLPYDEARPEPETP
mgnify:CR=1 FL=1